MNIKKKILSIAITLAAGAGAQEIVPVSQPQIQKQADAANAAPAVSIATQDTVKPFSAISAENSNQNAAESAAPQAAVLNNEAAQDTIQQIPAEETAAAPSGKAALSAIEADQVAAPADSQAEQPANVQAEAAEETAPNADVANANAAPASEPATENAAAAEAAPAESKAAEAEVAEAQATPAEETPAADGAPTEALHVNSAADSAAAESAASADDVDVAAAKAAINEVASQQPATETKNPLNVLHGNAYNIVGNEAAAATIGGDIAMPHKMRGHKLAYVEPIDGFGAISFGENTTYFVAFDNSQDLGKITAGFAKDRFGLSLEAALGEKLSFEDDDAAESELNTRATDAGSLLGINFSAKVSKFDIGAKAFLNIPETAAYAKDPNNEVDLNTWDAGGKLTFANSSSNSFAWALHLNILRHQAETKLTNKSIVTGEDGKNYLVTYKSTTTDSSSHVAIVPEFNMGGAVLSSEKARVYLGLNTAVPLVAYDRIDGIVSRHNEYGIIITPNILGEVALGNHVLAFGGASYQWDLLNYKDSYIQNVGLKEIESVSGTATANLGLRVYCDVAALELTFTQQFLQNPFGSFSDHEDIAVSLGAFVNF